MRDEGVVAHGDLQFQGDVLAASALISVGKYRLRWVTFVFLAFISLLVVMDNNIVNVALPTMNDSLHTSNSQLQWIVDSYALVFASFLITLGYVGDRYGHKIFLLLGLFGFAGTSVALAFSNSVDELITFRTILGFFAAMIYPATLASIMHIFQNGNERATAIGIWSATSGVAIALGPISGGYLLKHYSWPSIFWLNVPIALIAFFFLSFLLENNREANRPRFDIIGILLSITGVFAFIWSFIEAQNNGWLSARTTIGLATGTVVVILFIFWELHTKYPLIDVKLFANIAYSMIATAISVSFFSIFGFVYVITMYFQAIKNYSPFSSGLHILPYAICMAVFSPVAMILYPKLGPRLVIGSGLVISSIGFFLASKAKTDSNYWGIIIISMMLMASGMAFIQAPATEAIMSFLPLEKAGIGSAINDTTRELGAALGVAVIGSVLGTLYSSKVTTSLSSISSIPANQVTSLKSTIIAGKKIAEHYPMPLKNEVFNAVESSFEYAMHGAVLISSAASLTVGLLVLLFLPRHRKQTTKPTASRNEKQQTIPSTKQHGKHRKSSHN